MIALVLAHPADVIPVITFAGGLLIGIIIG